MQENRDTVKENRETRCKGPGGQGERGQGDRVQGDRVPCYVKVIFVNTIV